MTVVENIRKIRKTYRLVRGKIFVIVFSCFTTSSPLFSIFSMEFRGILDDDINKIRGMLKRFEKNIKEKKIYS